MLVRVVVQWIRLAQDLREMAVAEFEKLEKECGLQDDLRLVQSDFENSWTSQMKIKQLLLGEYGDQQSYGRKVLSSKLLRSKSLVQ